jgi:UDP-N-acetylmuramoyl-tripeptide--D-alanyl-D-alanine ligase
VQQVANAVCAAAAALALGLGPEAIRDGLESLTPVSGRMQRRRGARGCVLIDDSYNANPGSVRAAIDSLAAFARVAHAGAGNMANSARWQPCSCTARRRLCARRRHRAAAGLRAACRTAVADGFGAARRRAFRGSRERALAGCGEFVRRGRHVMLVKGSRSRRSARSVRSDGPQSHLSKAGTPTMGGASDPVAIAAHAAVGRPLGNRYVWIVLA